MTDPKPQSNQERFAQFCAGMPPLPCSVLAVSADQGDPVIPLDRLLTIASAAVPGFLEPYRMHGYAAEVVDADDETVANCNTEGGRIRGGTPAEYAMALHVATFSPAVAIALIERVQALEAGPPGDPDT